MQAVSSTDTAIALVTIRVIIKASFKKRSSHAGAFITANCSQPVTVISDTTLIPHSGGEIPAYR